MRADRAAKTVNLYRGALYTFFSRALQNGLLKANPVMAVKRFKASAAEKLERRPYTLEEVALIYDKAPDDFWRYMILGGFYTGLRLGDLICLSWGAVDWEHNQIHLTAIKTGRVLHIPLAKPLLSRLKALKVKAGKVGPSDPIWPDQAEEYQIQDARGFSQAFYEQIFISVRTGTPARWQAEESGSGGEQCYLSQLAAHVCKFVKGNRQFPICGQGIGRSFKRPGERSLYARARRGSGQGDQSVALVRLRQ